MTNSPITVKRLPLTQEIQITQADPDCSADIILVHPSQAEKLMEDLTDAMSEEFDLEGIHDLGRRTMNKERLIQLRDFLKDHKERFDYRSYCRLGEFDSFLLENWDTGSTPKVVEELTHNCQTVGCVAGWACALFGDEEEASNQLSIERYAEELLGIERYDSLRLFRSSNWIKEDNGLGIAIQRLGNLILECEYQEQKARE